MLHLFIALLPILDCKTSTHPYPDLPDWVQFGVSCVFPFTFRNRTYYSCTYEQISGQFFNYLPWCSTKVDENGNHDGNNDELNEDGTYNLGVCDPNEKPLKCPIPPRRKFLKRLRHVLIFNQLCHII